MIAFRRGERAVFLYGFGKNERSNIDVEELDAFRRMARALFALSGQQIFAMIANGELIEVVDDGGA